MKRFTTIIIFGLFSGLAYAQTDISAILADIKRNNKTLQAEASYWDAQNVRFKTGLTLYDPVVEYDFMRGVPNAVAGNQVDFTVMQRFDFPTVYGKKRGLAEEQAKQTTFYLLESTQAILLEAKVTCIELVYRNKLLERIEGRKRKTERYVNDFQRKMEQGEGNILDVNKAKLRLTEINKEYQLNISTINQLNQKLSALNGGIEVVLMDTIYPFDSVLDFGELEEAIEENHPLLKYLEQQQVIAQKDIEVTKAMTLPKFNVGYHYQGILGQKFYGGRIGMSIPLWENKNRVRQKHEELSTADARLEEHKNEHYYEIKQLYEQYESLGTTLREYQILLSSTNSLALLDKALALGEISTTEYFLEENYFYEACNNFLLTEKAYHEVIARLNEYQLH